MEQAGEEKYVQSCLNGLGIVRQVEEVSHGREEGEWE